LYVPDNNDIYDYYEKDLERYKRLYSRLKHEEEDIELEELPFYIKANSQEKGE
jgi:hypothetical protein